MDLLYFTFPEELSEFSIIFLIFSSIFTSFISAAFGIGGGAVFLGLLAIFLNPIALLPVHGSVQIASNFGRMLLMIKDVYKKPILPFFIGTIIGSLFGGYTFIQFPGWFIQLIVGIFILWTVYGKIPAIKSRYIIIGGVFSSFLTMFFGATGPFIAGMVKTMKLNPLSHTATHAALMSMQHAIKVLVFGFMGFSFSDYFHIILLMIISGFIGTYIGKKVLIKFGQKYFKIFLNSILTIISIYLILNGFLNYDFTFSS